MPYKAINDDWNYDASNENIYNIYRITGNQRLYVRCNIARYTHSLFYIDVIEYDHKITVQKFNLELNALYRDKY